MSDDEKREEYSRLIVESAEARASFMMGFTRTEKESNLNDYYSYLSAQLFYFTSLNWLMCIDYAKEEVFKPNEVENWLAKRFPYGRIKAWSLWTYYRNTLVHGGVPSAFVAQNKILRKGKHLEWPEGVVEVYVSLLPHCFTNNYDPNPEHEMVGEEDFFNSGKGQKILGFGFYFDKLIEQFLLASKNIAEDVSFKSSEDLEKITGIATGNVLITL